jgi:hypothetical protein
MSVNGSARRWPMAIAALVVCFVLISLEPVHLLRDNPPEGFRSVLTPAGIDGQRWSELYWERARLLQWKYSFGTRLPEQPEADFHISDEGTVPERVADQARRAYWNRLRSIWITPSPWKVSYSLGFGWIRQSIEKAGGKVVDFAKNIWHSVRD